MTERGFLVRLQARTDQYEAAMRKAQSTTEGFATGSATSLDKLGKGMVSAGQKMTAGVTLPIVGIGAASVKMSADFDASMSKIVGLVGISTEEVDGMKSSVLELAGRTATAPQELADGLFVLTSAGLRGDDAMQALEASAKASAAGLGATNDIARAVAGAMNAYGPGVLDAASATDILTATARAGNFETSQLAGSLGRVLPFAKQAQASMEDVGGAVALLTRTNGNASESITQVSALMRAFVTPTKQTEEALTGVGLTAEDVRDSMGEQGLVATLTMLDDKMGGNREQLGRLLGTAEGASAAFQILDADAEAIAGTFGVTADAAGMVGEAFGAAADTDALKMKQAMIDIKVAMIQVGSVLAPIVADVAGGIASLARSFSDLDPFLQKVVLGLAGVAAAAGPVLVITGKMVQAYKVLTTVQATSNLANLATAASLKRVAVAAGIAAAAYGAARSVTAGLTGDTEFLHREVSLLEKPFQMAGRLGYFIGGGYDSAADAERRFIEEAENAYAVVTQGVFTQEQLRERLDETSLSVEAQNLIIVRFADGLEQARQAEENLAEAEAARLAEMEAASAAEEGRILDLMGLTGALERAEVELQRVALADQFAELAAEAHAEAMIHEMETAEAVLDAMLALAEATQERVDAARAAADATFALRDAEDRHQGTLEKLTEVLADSEATTRDLEQAQDDVASSAAAVADSHVRIAEETAKMDGAQLAASRRISILNQSLLDQAAAADGEARAAIIDYVLAINDIPAEHATEIQTLIDEGQYGAALIKVNALSETRQMTVIAEANTAQAERDLNWLLRDRTIRVAVGVVGGAIESAIAGAGRAGDTGGYLPRGTLVAERGPEMVDGHVVAVPSLLNRASLVTGRAATRHMSAIGQQSHASAAGIAAAVSSAMPKTMILEVDGQQMRAHVRGVIDAADEESLAVLAGGVR